MEKQANKSFRKVFGQKFHLTFLFLIVFALTAFAQKRDIEGGKKYTIGNIEVVGAESFNPVTIVAFSGLKKGDEIAIPGEEISNVIKKLWRENLFSDVNIYVTRIEDNVADLEINIKELPTLNEVSITGIRKGKVKEILKETKLDKGTKITNNLLTNTKNYIANKYREKGFLNTQVVISTQPVIDSTGTETARDMKIAVNPNKKVKIKHITINGNEAFSNRRVRRHLKKTKRKNPIRLLKRSKYIEDQYREDLVNLISKYKEQGYRDARVISDSMYTVDHKTVGLNLKVEEGNQYRFGDIRFIGNSVYTDEQLRRLLGIAKGDIYNGVLLDKKIEDKTNPEADDITNTYQNNGYLFSQVNPVEVNVQNDTIDFEIRIREGKLAYFNNISVSGNDVTNDHVIYRELRVKPGQKYSKRNVVRTIRELGQLGFFNPENIEPKFENVDPNSGTLDMEFVVEEQGSSQIELQGGYGGGGFVGTLGLSFNNFSLRNIFNRKAYQPLPRGDGQRLSLRAQASTFYQTYNLSVVEPWLGGRQPVQLSVSFSHTEQYAFDFASFNVDRSQRFLISGGSVGLAKRLKWPDDSFILSNSISFQHFNLKNYYNNSLFTFGDGFSNNLAYTIGISRDNTYTNPIFPTGGSMFSLSAKMTPPFSLLNKTDYDALGDNPLYQHPNGDPDRAKIDQEKFKWLEYYKIKFNGTWYTRLIDQLVLRSHAEFGFLGGYNNQIGAPPFERFYVGGDGLGAFSLDGREVVALRGYQNQAITGTNDGHTIFNKFTLEMRYPITLKPMASIFGLAFAEGGTSYNDFGNFNPFLLKRSAGAGIRIFMPAFGLLGIDFGYGFDPIPGQVNPSGWQTHFIIGQQF